MNIIRSPYLSKFLKLVLTIAISLGSLHVAAQQIIIDIHGKKVGEFLVMEQKAGNKVFMGDGDIVVPGGMAMPIVYRIPQINIPDMLVTYTFDQKDSLLNSIEYEIDIINFDSKNKGISLIMQKAMIKKYGEMLSYLTKKIGESQQKGDLSDLSKIDQRGGITQSNNWMPNDTTYINLYSIFSNYEEQKGNITIKRLTELGFLYQKSKNLQPSLVRKIYKWQNKPSINSSLSLEPVIYRV